MQGQFVDMHIPSLAEACSSKTSLYILLSEIVYLACFQGRVMV